MADDAVALTQQLNTLTESLDSVMDKMKEMLRLFGRIDSRGGSALRGLNTQSRNLNDNFRQIVERMAKLSTPATTVGAAATSQALGALTGQGGGGGGGFGGMAAHRGNLRGGKMADSLLNPLKAGLPAFMGAAFASPGKLGSQFFRNRFGPTSKLGKAAGFLGDAMGHTTAMATGLGLGAASDFIKQAYAQHHGLELAGRRLHGDIYGGMKAGKPETVGGQPSPGAYSGQQYGYTRQQSAALFGAIQAGAGSGTGDMGYLGNLAMSSSLRDQFRVDPGAILGLAGTLKAGNMQPGQMTGRVMQTMADQGFRGRGDTERLTLEYLSGIQALLGQQVSSRGRLSESDVNKAYGLMDALSRPKDLGGLGLFDPRVGGQVASGLVAGVRSPGGGEAGQIAVLQAMGFGNPNMGALNQASRSMGGTGGFQRTDYISALMMQENPGQHVDRLLAQTKVIGGDDPRHQAVVLNQMTGIGINKAYDVMTNATDVNRALKDAIAAKRKPADGVGPGDDLPLQQSLLRRLTSALTANKTELVSLTDTMTKLHESLGQGVIPLLKPLAGAVKTTGGALRTAIDELTKALRTYGGRTPRQPQQPNPPAVRKKKATN